MEGGGGGLSVLLGWVPLFLFCSSYTLSAIVLHKCNENHTICLPWKYVKPCRKTYLDCAISQMAQ